MKHVVLLLAAIALPLVVYYNTLGAQRQKQFDQDYMRLKELNVRVEQVRAAQRKLSQFHEESARLASELLKLQTILPATMEMDQIHTLVQAKAEARGVRLTRFDADENQSVTAEVIGATEATSEFFRDIQNAERIIDVSSVTLSKDPAGWRTDFVMRSYAMTDVH
jgi:Tfp pilus assembly protein PilO